MTITVGGSNITFPDSTVQNTSALVSGKVPYAYLPTGSVLQVVTASYATNLTTSSSTWVTTGLSASITPSSTSSKILVIVNQSTNCYSSNSYVLGLQLWRGGSSVLTLTNANGDGTNAANSIYMMTPITYLDSPASASSVTYTTYYAATSTASGPYGNFVGVQPNSTPSIITLLEIAG